MFTVSMALGSQELSKRGVLITRLNVIEDCALMSILFSDKTGTSVHFTTSIHACTRCAASTACLHLANPKRAFRGA
jgi:cation transport ATPase